MGFIVNKKDSKINSKNKSNTKRTQPFSKKPDTNISLKILSSEYIQKNRCHAYEYMFWWFTVEMFNLQCPDYCHYITLKKQRNDFQITNQSSTTKVTFHTRSCPSGSQTKC